MRRLVVICCLLIGFTSCKPKKSMADAGRLKNISAKKIWKNNKTTFGNYKTVSAKAKGKFKDHKTSAGFTLTLRMETDKVIWMSIKKLGFPVAKLKITPDKVMFYEKVKRTYFEGNFSLISDFLGTSLNFNQLQNVLLGRPVVELKSNQLVSDVFMDDYRLSLKKQHDLYELFFNVNPIDFTLKKQQLKEVSSSNTMEVKYPKFAHKIPRKIEVRVLAKSKKTFLDLEYKSVQFNKELRFPFSIPKGYKKISLKK